MRLALAQYSLTSELDENLTTALAFVRNAAAAGAQIVLFPELCLSVFFPQFPGSDASGYAMCIDDSRVEALRLEAREAKLHAVPNVYLQENAARFDASIFFAPDGGLLGVSKMVHVAQAPGFYEQDYYEPSDTGFLVYDTSLGRIGIVVCFDRHFPESIRTCVLRGAQLILIPSANTAAEPRDMFEWELRVAARQNGVWIAMCNRTGAEGDAEFCGESIIVDPEGNVTAKAGTEPQLLVADLDLAITDTSWQRQAYLGLRRPDCYI